MFSVIQITDCPDVKNPQFMAADITQTLTDEDFVISDEDIISAISAISPDSGCGPDGVPVCLLKTCAQELCQPIKLIWTESYKLGLVPKFYKETHISPLSKRETGHMQ